MPWLANDRSCSKRHEFCAIESGCRTFYSDRVKRFVHVPHPHIEARKHRRPLKVAKNVDRGGRIAAFNASLAVKITAAVGTMWCAYIFAVIALISLPDAIRAGRPAIIAWIAQTFLQLVLLSIIIVGQNVQAAATDERSQATYEDADAVLHTALQIQDHLQAQDDAIETLLNEIALLKSHLTGTPVGSARTDSDGR